MSVVVAIKEGNKVYIGADSQSTKGSTRYSLTNPNNYKIWKVKNVDNCFMAHVGSVKDACAIRVMNDLVDELDALHDEIDFSYVVKYIEPHIREELIDHKFIGSENPYKDMDSRFLFVYKDKIFTIEYGCVIEHDDFVSIGSGESEAIGSLMSTQNIKDPRERIIKAIKSSAAHDIYVDYPIVLVNSFDEEFEIITDKD